MKLHETMRRLHPVAEPSTDLSARIEAMADVADRATPRLRRLPVLVAAGFCAAGLAGIALFSAPKQSIARTMETVYTNVRKARGIHCTISFAPGEFVPNTVATKASGAPREGLRAAFEVWRLGGSSRTDFQIGGKTFSQITANGLFWNVYPADKRADYQKAGSAPSPPFDAEALYKSVTETLRAPHRTDLGIVTENGRRLRKVAVASPVQRNLITPPTPGRSVFVIDDTMMLPVRVEDQLPDAGGWRTVCTIRYDFRVSPRDFTIPSDFEKYSVTGLGERAGSEFARPLAEKRFTTRTIALRDVQVNRDGDLFVLYTDGEKPTKGCENSFASIVSDSRGTRYTGTAGGITPFMFCDDTASNRGLVVDGQAIHGFCAVPVTPVTGEWLPRTVTIEVHYIEYVRTKAFTRTALFTVPVRKQRTTLLPTYAPYLAKLSLAGGDPAQFKVAREWTRRTSLYNKGDWQGIVRSTSREIQENIADVNTYLSRAEAFQNLRQWDGARDALAQAERKDALGFYGDQITEARKKLQAAR
ncbi:MAG: hypothetical protein H7145_04895 [Akkermansiaceae bacterium]|nr:hypothetical protein [Armatimonadota bacterium]